MRQRLGVALDPRSGCRDPDAIASTRSSQRTIAGQLSASTAVSPYSSYSSHGTSTTASPQPAEPFIFSRNPVRSATGIGAMLPRLPSAHCSTTRSRSHFTEKPATS